MKEIINILPHLPIIFICNIFYNLCYAKLTNNRFKVNIRNFIIIFIATILILLNNCFNIVIVKVIINFIIFVIELKLVFKESYKKIIINYIFIDILIIMIEMCTTTGLHYLGILESSDTASKISILSTLVTIIISIIEYILISIPFINKFFKKIINFFEENNAIINVIYILFVAIVIIAMINIENFASEDSIKLLLVLCAIFIILFSLIIRLQFNTSILKMSNKKLMDYNGNYGKFLDEYKIYKHNINNKLSAIKSYGNKKVNALIDDLLDEENEFSIRNNEMYKVPNGIKGIIAEKLYNKKYDILIDNKIENDPFASLPPKVFNNISECLGIALDNAIEAAEETKKPFIMINLNEDKESIRIKVVNPYCNKIDLDKLGEKHYSTKNRGSGYGLFSIKNNKFIEEEIIIENGNFNLEIKIPKNKKASK